MSKIDFYLMRSQKGLQQAADLVQFEYEKDGYVKVLEKDERVPISKYNKESSSFTFLAKNEELVLGTVSLVCDGKFGIPLDSIFAQEMQLLRAKGKKCAEISQLAIRRDAVDLLGLNQRKIQMLLLLPLFKLVFYCAKACEIDTLCITINPKHDKFYLALGFEPLGEEKTYEAVGGAPALLRKLELDRASEMQENIVTREILNGPIEFSFLDNKNDKVVFSQGY